MAGPALDRRAIAAAAVVVVAIAAWVVTGAVVRRAQAARLPALADLSGVPEPAQAAIREADAAARRQPDPATVGALGRAYHAAQLPVAALDAYALAEALAPDDASWTYLRALLLEERNDAATDAALQRAAERGAGAGYVWYRIAERAFKQGRLDDADAAYARAADAAAVPAFVPAGVTARQTWPLSVYAGVGQTRVALERGDRSAALDRLRRLVESYPAFGPARTWRRIVEGGSAATGSEAAYVPPADPVLDALVASSRHSDVLLKYAGVAARGGDAAWREFLVRRALEFNPDDLNVLMEVAAMLQATGRPADALPYLARHERLAPGDHHGLVEQGQVLADLGRLPEAEAVLRRAVVVRDAAAEYNLGMVLDRQGRWDEARAHYERALTINPFHARSMNNLGAGLARSGDSSAGLTWLEKALALTPDAAEVYVNYGSALIAAGRFDDAARVLTTAVALAPRDPNAHNNLGIAWASLGDLPKARDAFTQALAIDPRDANARRNLDAVTARLVP